MPGIGAAAMRDEQRLRAPVGHVDEMEARQRRGAREIRDRDQITIADLRAMLRERETRALQQRGAHAPGERRGRCICQRSARERLGTEHQRCLGERGAGNGAHRAQHGSAKQATARHRARRGAKRIDQNLLPSALLDPRRI